MADISVLSAGAVKGGLSDAARLFETRTEHRVTIAFATAPVLRSRVEAGEVRADVLIAPVPALAEFEGRRWLLTEPRALIGSIKAGVAVRKGRPMPDVSSTRAFKDAVLAARSLVYNEGSSGLYIAKLMEKLGVAREVEAKTKRFPTGGEVLRYLAGSKVAEEIGFGQVTEILFCRDQGVVLVGALPEEIGNVTTYGARIFAHAAQPRAGAEFVGFLSEPKARELLVATGIL